MGAFTFVALYAAPDDPAAFEEYYRSTHAQICARWPGLRSSTVTVFSGTPRGTESPYALKGEFAFATRDAFMMAMQSEAGTESQRDARHMVERFGVQVTMLLGETDVLSGA